IFKLRSTIYCLEFTWFVRPRFDYAMGALPLRGGRQPGESNLSPLGAASAILPAGSRGGVGDKAHSCAMISLARQRKPRRGPAVTLTSPQDPPAGVPDHPSGHIDQVLQERA